MLRAICWVVLSLAAVVPALEAQIQYVAAIDGAETHLYKTVGDVELRLHLFRPQGVASAVPGIVFFFGGGWRQGSPLQFLPHAQHLAERGMLVALADYRVLSRHGTTPVEAVKDARSAIRWLRTHSDEIGLDREHLAAGGGSAGGHLAACTALIDGVDEASDDLAVSARPDALVLFNPALDLSGLANSRWAFDGDPLSISPLQHVRPGMPPTLLFHGTGDTVVPYRQAVAFTESMQAAGNTIELVSFEGRGHGFFNYGRDDNQDYEATITAMDRFLVNLDFLPAEE